MQIKVATYNVHNTDGTRSLGGIGLEIKQINPDFIGLQELDVGVGRSLKKNTLAELNKICRFPSAVFAKSIDYDGGDYGIGAMFNYPLVSMQKYLLPSTAEQRIAIKLVLETKVGNISFYNTHLALDAVERKKQLDYISALLISEERFILTGDFNIDSFDELDVIKNAKIANCKNNPINTFKPNGCIDNILISNNLGFANIKLNESEYSDHNMLVAEIIA